MGSEDKKEIFSGALQGKKIPILTLDNKWYRLLDETGRTAAGELTEHLNSFCADRESSIQSPRKSGS